MEILAIVVVPLFLAGLAYVAYDLGKGKGFDQGFNEGRKWERKIWMEVTGRRDWEFE